MQRHGGKSRAIGRLLRLFELFCGSCARQDIITCGLAAYDAAHGSACVKGDNMKWIIASDIHGSEQYCEKLLERVNEEKADAIFLLGDILYHGPRNALPGEYQPMAVAEMLNAKKDMITCVRGNCDAEVDQMVLEFPIMADYALMSYGNRRIFFTHGHLFDKTNPPMLKEGDVMVYGHFHVQDADVKNGIIFINPGSVSIPKNGSRHGYILFEDGIFLFKDVLTGETFNKYSL